MRYESKDREFLCRGLKAVMTAVGVLVLAGCGAEAARPSDTKTVVQTATATATVTTTPTASAPGTDEEDGQVGSSDGAADAGSFSMPDEVGKVLQAAQDDLQAVSGNPLFYSDSVDATGADRFQVLDNGWQVCAQSKKPGAKVAADDTSIVFEVVRVSENCP